MAQKITINLEVKGEREPELYVGIQAIPEVCRDAVLRGLLKLAISTPPHLVAASARSAGALFSKDEIVDATSITRKLTFQSNREDDKVLHEYFSSVPKGRRLQTVRSLLMMGLLTQQAPQQSATQSMPASTTSVDVGAGGQDGLAQKQQSVVPPAQQVTVESKPAGSAPQTDTILTAAQGESHDLEELFGAIEMKV